MSTYQGPSMGELIRSHALAAAIINNRDTPNDILDPGELLRLKRFCEDPSQKDAILKECGMTAERGESVGTEVTSQSSLAGYCIARHGTENPALEEREIQMLKDWFENGGAAEDIKVAEERGLDSYYSGP